MDRQACVGMHGANKFPDMHCINVSTPIAAVVRAGWAKDMHVASEAEDPDAANDSPKGAKLN
jgi:hypothetical protein